MQARQKTGAMNTYKPSRMTNYVSNVDEKLSARIAGVNKVPNVTGGTPVLRSGIHRGTG